MSSPDVKRDSKGRLARLGGQRSILQRLTQPVPQHPSSALGKEYRPRGGENEGPESSGHSGPVHVTHVSQMKLTHSTAHTSIDMGNTVLSERKDVRDKDPH